MSENLPSDSLLSALRDRKYDAHGTRSVKREQLDALVECAEALKRSYKFYKELAESGCINDSESQKGVRWDLQEDCCKAFYKLEDL